MTGVVKQVRWIKGLLMCSFVDHATAKRPSLEKNQMVSKCLDSKGSMFKPELQLF